MADIQCKGCGAALAFSPSHLSLKCQFCGQDNPLPTAAAGSSPAPDAAPSEKVVLPGVAVGALGRKALQYLAEDEDIPRLLLALLAIKHSEMLLVPVWRLEVNFEAEWSAQVGTEREDDPDEYDWRAQNGSDRGSVTLFAYAGNRLDAALFGPRHLACKVAEKGMLQEYVPALVSEFAGEPAVLSAAQAIADLDDDINDEIESTLADKAGGDDHKDWRINARKSVRSTLVQVPIGHVVVSSKGVDYNVWLDGVDATDGCADALPEDEEGLVESSTLLGYLPLVTGGVTALVCLYLWPPQGATVFWLAVALLYALLRRRAVRRQEQQLTLASSLQAQGATAEDTKPPFFCRHTWLGLLLAVLVPVGMAGAPDYLSATARANAEAAGAPFDGHVRTVEIAGFVHPGLFTSVVGNQDGSTDEFMAYFRRGTPVDTAITAACKPGVRCAIDGDLRDGELIALRTARSLADSSPAPVPAPAAH